MSYALLFSDHGYAVYHHEQAQFKALQQELEQLKQQRELLAQSILRLRHEPQALEDLVHRELGYVYPDEYMLIMPADLSAVKESGK
ncbi:MAG: septum formation initiator family protein [Mariprofundaceae bacterium]